MVTWRGLLCCCGYSSRLLGRPSMVSFSINHINLQNSVTEYIDFFNSPRPHQNLATAPKSNRGRLL